MSAKDFNPVQMISFLVFSIALTYLFIRFVYIKMDENTSKQKDTSLGSSWKIIRPELNQEEVKKLILNIDEFNEKWSNINSDFVSGEKHVRGDFKIVFNTLYRKYLELVLKGESIINDKKDGLAPKYLKTEMLENYIKRLKEKKESIDIIKENLNMEVQENQQNALNILTVAETVFLPLGVLVGFFGMNFSNISKKGAFATFGVTHSIKSAHLLMWAAMLIVASVTAVALKYYVLTPNISNFEIMNKLIPEKLYAANELPGHSNNGYMSYV